MAAHPIKLLQLFAFPGITRRSREGTVSYAGLWETISVTGLDTADPVWTLRLVVMWADSQPLGTEMKMPQSAFPLLKAGRVDRAALRGVPVET